MEGFGWYTYEVVKRMVLAHPEHEFVFFFDRKVDPKFLFASHVEPVVLFPQARHPLLFVWWFEWSIPRALKKHRIDLFYSPDGYLSLRSQVPQIAVIHDINFEHHPEDIPAWPLRYLRNYFPKFAKKAEHVLTVSEFSKQDLIHTYGLASEKITVAWNGGSEQFVPLNEQQIEAVRSRFTQGKPYFIFVGAIHPRKNVGQLIQSFEKFAQTNQSIDLLLVGDSMWSDPHFSSLNVSDSLKKRIVFTGHVDMSTLTQLMGAAYALVYVSYFEGFGIPLVEAMRCGIPIISGNKTALPEVVGDAALLVNPHDETEIVEAMKLLANNSKLVEELSTKSKARAQLFSWDNTAKTTWEVIEQTLTACLPDNPSP
jgi:glycosyltransferase involved in cell wall biosynthesis